MIAILNKHSLAFFVKYANQLCDGVTVILVSAMSFWTYAITAVLVIFVGIS